MSSHGAQGPDHSVGADAYADFHELVRTLRQRCPWDVEQTHRSLIPYLIEETYEVVDAIAALDPSATPGDDELIEELGDLWYQVEFHAAIAEQEGRFTMTDVVRGIHHKLVRRHPHVFDPAAADRADAGATTEEVLDNWDAIKRAEKPERSSVFDGVPRSLPSLPYAAKVQSKAAKLGFDWPDAAVSASKVTEELREVGDAAADGDADAVADEIGDLLFAVVNLARHYDVDPETALRAAANKFRARFEHIEGRKSHSELAALDDAELDDLWASAKRAVGTPRTGTRSDDGR